MASSSTRCLLFVACVSLGLLGCKSDAKKSPADDVGVEQATPDANQKATNKKPVIEKEDGPMPGPDKVLASAGPHKVTLADYEKASQISLLFAPAGITEMPPARMALPHVHVTMTQSLLSQKLIDAEAKRRGLEVTDEEIAAWLRKHEQLSRFGRELDDPAKARELLEPYDLTVEDLKHIAQTELLNDKVEQALLEDVPKDEVWKAYEVERTTRTLALVSTKNVPSSDEIDEWMGDHADEIDTYFHKNQTSFRIPKRVKLNIVKPKPGTEVSDDVLKKAAADLGKGIQPVTVAKTHGLVETLGQQLVQAENKRAFGMRPGEVGWTSDGPRGAYAWKVVGFEPSRLPEMTRALRREIAAEILRTKQLTPGVEKRLESAIALLQKADPKPGDEAAMDALENEVEAIDGLEFEVTTFPNSPGGNIPNHGLAEEVLEAAFDTKVGNVSDPILSRERGFAFKVLAAVTASRKQFESNYDANRKAYLDALRPRMVQMWTRQQLNELGARLDVQPLRIKYGVLQK